MGRVQGGGVQGGRVQGGRAYEDRASRGRKQWAGCRMQMGTWVQGTGRESPAEDPSRSKPRSKHARGPSGSASRDASRSLGSHHLPGGGTRYTHVRSRKKEVRKSRSHEVTKSRSQKVGSGKSDVRRVSFARLTPPTRRAPCTCTGHREHAHGWGCMVAHVHGWLRPSSATRSKCGRVGWVTGLDDA